jgi:Bacterial SH3 domain
MLRKTAMLWGFVMVAGVLVQWPDAGHGQFVTVEPDPPTYAEVTVDKLNVRTDATKDADVVTQLNKGDWVPVKADKDGWAQLAWNNKAYVSDTGINLPGGKINGKVFYEQLRLAFISHARDLDPTIEWVEVPRATGITVRYHWREYQDKAALIKRCEELARLYSVMTVGETGVTVDILNGNDLWARAFF